MARRLVTWYVAASLLITLAVYEALTITGYSATLGPLLFALVIIFVLPVGFAVWVYLDASDRGWNGGFWALVVTFIPLGFAIYAIARTRRGREMIGAVWYAMYGIVIPILFLGVALIAGYGGILLVIAVILWMGFALAMAAPAPEGQTP